MKRLSPSLKVSLLTILAQCADNVWSFEGRNQRPFGVPPRRRRGRHLRASSRAAEHFDDDNLDQGADGPLNLERRKVLRSSAAAFAAAVLMGNAEPAQASTALILEESEKRRIDTFEKCAPSVVFIDTFTQKQDAFSTNSIDVPIGTGSGFVWDKEGHIGM